MAYLVAYLMTYLDCTLLLQWYYDGCISFVRMCCAIEDSALTIAVAYELLTALSHDDAVDETICSIVR